MKKGFDPIILVIFFSLLFQLTTSQTICDKIIEYHKNNSSLESEEYQKNWEELKNIQHDDCMIALQPNYVWAQNMSFIMVKFQFDISSRTSCSKLIFSQQTVTYQGFSLKHYCLQSNNLIKYQIDVRTYKNLNYHFSRWKSTQMNGLILQALKSPTPYFWPKLYSESVKLQKKPRIWWQLQQKQDQTVQKYMVLLQIDESEVQISSYVKKLSKKAFKKRQNKKHQIQFVIFQQYSVLQLGISIFSWVVAMKEDNYSFGNFYMIVGKFKFKKHKKNLLFGLKSYLLKLK